MPNIFTEVCDSLSNAGYYWRIEKTPAGRVTVSVWKNGIVITERGIDACITLVKAATKVLNG